MNQPSSVREDPQSVPQVLTSDKCDDRNGLGRSAGREHIGIDEIQGVTARRF
jgi:hypothetical protein